MIMLETMGNGWVSARTTWTYASADDPTYTFTISGDYTGILSAGMKIKLTQTTVKYFIITKVAYGSPNTTVTVYGGTDYDLADATITSPYYSYVKAPFGFPLASTKWQVLVTDTANNDQSSPTNGIWYNPGSLSISLPIGAWNVLWQATGYYTSTGGTDVEVRVTLSTANNSESDSTLTGRYFYRENDNAAHVCYVRLVSNKSITVTSGTTYYLNCMTAESASIVGIRGSANTTTIRAICAYL